ncbi:MAG TPA: (Fe-S)-binding protein [Fimbriimonadaceae bacterium]|nr:(Fe-S)-binding protein [Fimbriimonadaceae bacterium]
MKSLDDLTAQCIRCGFCLESCPTFVLSGEETESPRGRIYLARSAAAGTINWQDAKPHLDTCLGCRACETACPSGVKYGEILEQSREIVEQSSPNLIKSKLIDVSTDAKKLKLSGLWPGKRMPGFASRLISSEAPEADIPRPVHRDFPPLINVPEVKEQVWLLEGCAMKVLFPSVHEATKRLLRRLGFQANPLPFECCGALHAHNGHLSEGTLMRSKLLSSLGDSKLVLNSAGCGSWIKEGGSNGVFDLSEFLVENGLIELLRQAQFKAKITYHDACHLAHGQGVREAPRQLLAAIPGAEVVSLPESDMCCGSAGVYNVLQPKRARALLNRKWKNIESTGAQIVVQGNPGCHAWIAQAAREHGGTVEVMHLAEVLEIALSN